MWFSPAQARPRSSPGDLRLRLSQDYGGWHWSCCPCQNRAKGGGRAIGILTGPPERAVGMSFLFLSFSSCTLLSQAWSSRRSSRRLRNCTAGEEGCAARQVISGPAQAEAAIPLRPEQALRVTPEELSASLPPDRRSFGRVSHSQG